MTEAGLPKYKRILEELRRSISSGKYKPGDRLPGEVDLGAQFGVSRLTIQRVLKELQIEGLVDRRAGSGTYVTEPARCQDGLLFGLLIPGLGETEIFEPICQGMARAGRNGNHALLWGDTTQHTSDENSAIALCQDYVKRQVSGVFFAPIEGTADKDKVNDEIMGLLLRAKIPVVLLDRCAGSYPERSGYDLVGIDNRRAGHLVTRHLLNLGAKSLMFVARPYAAPTVDSRIGGFIDAGASPDRVLRVDPVAGLQEIARVMQNWKPDGIVCANDKTAAEVMQALERLGYRVPDQVRIAGFDDVRYARLLQVPLTTLRQPCQDIGETAIEVMLSRIANPSRPALDVLLSCELIVRQSCGANRRS